VLAGEPPVAEAEQLDPAQRLLERAITEVRMRAGLPVAGAAQERAAVLARDGLLEPVALAGGRAVLTLRGRQVADLVTRELALAA
jgi:oxygen-independent coproporphyrinogen-3 oxidase